MELKDKELMEISKELYKDKVKLKSIRIFINIILLVVSSSAAKINSSYNFGNYYLYLFIIYYCLIILDTKIDNLVLFLNYSCLLENWNEKANKCHKKMINLFMEIRSIDKDEFIKMMSKEIKNINENKKMIDLFMEIKSIDEEEFIKMMHKEIKDINMSENHNINKELERLKIWKKLINSEDFILNNSYKKNYCYKMNINDFINYKNFYKKYILEACEFAEKEIKVNKLLKYVYLNDELFNTVLKNNTDSKYLFTKNLNEIKESTKNLINWNA